MTIAPVTTGPSGIDIDKLAQMYQQQVAGNTLDPATASSTATGQAAAIRSADFGDMIGNSLQKLENLDLTAQNKAIQAATGDLNDVHDYVIAATEAQTATELTTTLRNKALDSFNEIMRMPL